MEKRGERALKRERNVNFTREETERLVQLLVSKKHIIENKRSDSVTWQEKENAWQTIESEFNSSNHGPYRDAKHLKFKYEALKRDTRKKCNREDRYKTGSGTSTATPLTPVEIKLKELILLSVEGGESSFDSDDVHSNKKYELKDEPLRKKPLASTSKGIESVQESLEAAANTLKWDQRKPAKEHSALFKEKELDPIDEHAKVKIEIADLQKTILEEEMAEKVLRSAIIKLELEHKKEIFQLEKEEFMLKIEILKIQLENYKKDE